MSINLKKLEMTLVENRYNQSGVIDNKDGLALVAELREARKRIAELEAERDALKVDAERYRFLRNAVVPTLGVSKADVIYMQHLHGEELDEAIDAAKEQQ